MSTKLFTAKLFTAKLLVAGLLTTVALGQAQAAPTSQDGTGPYAGIELARAHFGISSALPSTARDNQATGGRLYGGYRFTPNFGLEAGYAGLGSLSETVTVGGGAVTQDAKARSLYAAGTAQMPLTDALALRGKSDNLDQRDRIHTEAQELNLAYQLNRNWSISSGVRYDNREDDSPVPLLTQFLMTRAGW